MSSHGSGAALGLDPQPSCSIPVPVPRNSLLARPLPPPWSGSLARLGQEDTVESYSGSSCHALGAAVLECECSAPDPQLVRRIVAQVEFYLSDENLAKDAFLLKHVQKNKMGFVSIKLLTSFKKVKYLTRDWHLTLYALKFSALLEVNKEGTKVRRRLPVPEHLLSIPPSKLLLAWELQPREQDLPLQKNFLEIITRMFGPFGAIASIRLLRPGRKLPSDVRKYSSRFPELLSRCCALVEYESLESARRAFESLGHRDWHGIRVVRLCGKGGKKKAGEERPGWKVPPAALTFPRSLEEPQPSSSPEPDDASGWPSLLLDKELAAPTWPGSDFVPGNSNAFPESLLTSKGLPLLGMGLGAGRGWGSAARCWTPWGRGLGPAAEARPGTALAAQWEPEPLSPWDGVLCLPRSPEGTESFGRGGLVLRR